jgi:hypothetical protein
LQVKHTGKTIKKGIAGDNFSPCIFDAIVSDICGIRVASLNFSLHRLGKPGTIFAMPGRQVCSVFLTAYPLSIGCLSVMLSSPLLPDSVAHTELPKSESKSAVARQVRMRLRRCGYADMRRVEVSIVGNVLRLSGLVYSYHMKQLAQEVARQTVPAAIIENDLTVVCSPRVTPK